MADAIDDALDAALLSGIAGPKRVRGDEGEVEQRDISDLLALAKYRRSSAGDPLGRIRLTKLVPPGID